MKRIFLLTFIVGILATVSSFGKQKGPSFTSTKNACSVNEKWRFTPKVKKEWRFLFSHFVANRISNVRAFSEALALRRSATNLESQVFSEYWISRALFNAGLFHIAHNGFTAVASRPTSPSIAGIQAASFQCLMNIQRRYPTMSLKPATWPALYALTNLKKASFKPVIWEAASSIVRDLVSRGANAREVRKPLTLLKGSGAPLALAQGIAFASQGKYDQSAKWMRKFLSYPSVPKYVLRYRDPAKIILGRSLYSAGRYPAAVERLKRIEKDSNVLAQSLNELAWSYLQADRHREAIGTAINLQSGSLRNTFAPESLAVMAMGLNELCQYPEAVKAIRLFRKNYKKSYFWLKNWHDRYRNKRTDFYRLTINFLESADSPEKRKKYRVPFKVASEWMRSPLFIARQDEINLLFDEQDDTLKLGKKGAQEQLKMARALLKFTRDLKERYDLARVKLSPGESLPATIQTDLAKLRKDARTYRRLRQAAPVWRRILSNHRQAAKNLEMDLIRSINQDLRLVSIRMFRQISEVAQKNQMIEVEIYSGATNDIIWQNAHPDYKEVAQELKDEDSQAVDSAKVYDWGHTSGGLDGTGEIWEDELGSFKADLYDNCDSKNKYMALKYKRRSPAGQK